MWEHVVGSEAHRWLDLGLWLLVLLPRPSCQHSQLWTRHGKSTISSKSTRPLDVIKIRASRVTCCRNKFFFWKNKCIFLEIEIKTGLATALKMCYKKWSKRTKCARSCWRETAKLFPRLAQRAIELVGRRSDLVTRSWGGQWSIRGIASPAIDNSSGGREAHQALRIAWLVPSPLLLQCSLISSIYGTTHCGH